MAGDSLLGEECDPMTWCVISIPVLPTTLSEAWWLETALSLVGGGCCRAQSGGFHWNLHPWPKEVGMRPLARLRSHGEVQMGDFCFLSPLGPWEDFLCNSGAGLSPCSLGPLTSLSSWKQPVGRRSHATPPTTRHSCFLRLPLPEAR